MRNTAAIAALTLLLTGAADASAEVRLSDVMQVLGRVSEAAGPVEDALVIAFNLSSSYIIQTSSQKNGRFALPPLPAGVYRIIAVKRGFAPAVATVTPSRKPGRELSLRLEVAKDLSSEEKDAIWRVRRAIPSDILRELNIVDESITLASTEPDPARFRGEMVSMTGFGEPGAMATFAQTELGVQGVIGAGWMVDVSGSIRTMDDDAGVIPTSGTPFAEAADLTMEIRSGGASAYKIATSRTSWLLASRDGIRGPSADLESHNIEWRGGRSHVSLNYLSHENLFAHAPFGSERVELAAESRIFDGDRGQLGVGVRVGQESASGATFASTPFRSAEVITRGSYEVLPRFAIRYGLNSRITEGGSEWAPETGFVVNLTPSTALSVRGSYKIDELERPDVYPSLVFLDRPSRMSPAYEYAVSITSGTTDAARFTATASVAEVDSVLRLVFDDVFEEFWDGFYLQPNDTYRALSVAVQKQLGENLAIDVASRAGHATNPAREESDKHFVAGSVQSLYIPSGTAVLIAWRFIEQPGGDDVVAFQESERINLRLAQSLGLPLGLRLLVGVDLARSANSSVVADGEPMEDYQRRLVGGLSFAF
ncbi:MAG: carboxypeptidase-like regulatory domain-containing protein [Thermoanaerobaculia bacterium]